MRAGDGAIKNFSVGGVTLRCSLAAGLVLLTTWQSSRAAEADWALPPPSVSAPSSAPLVAGTPEADAVSNFLAAWAARAEQVRANQPAWSSPLVTTTGMLEQRFRFDGSEQQAGNGADTRVTDGGKGLDLIVSNSNEVQIAAPPYELRDTPTGKGAFTGFGDWAFLRVKQQLASSPASGDNYFVTMWLQVQAPTGIGPLTNNSWTYLPTFAFGKGWGDFDIQATMGGVLPASHVATLGDQIQTNVAFQYHLMTILWPEFEVNWTHYVGGQRDGLDQVFLTAGVVLGRFRLTDRVLFTTGAGYQFAVSPSFRPNPLTPVYNHAMLFTSRFNF